MFNYCCSTSQKSQGEYRTFGVPAKGKAQSTTKSAIAPGEIEVTKDKDFDVNKINRDTKNTANKLKPIFDPQKVYEQQQAASIFSELGFTMVGKIAAKNNWANDDPRRLLLHAVIGGTVSAISGGSFGQGMKIAVINKLLVSQLAKARDKNGHKIFTDTDLLWLSSAIGALTGEISGGSAAQGAAIAGSATKYNELLTAEEMIKYMGGTERLAEYCKTLGQEPTPENLANMEQSIKNSIEYYKRGGDAVVITASSSFGLKGLGAQQAVIHDLITNESYVVSGGSLGISAGPGAASISGIKLMTNEPNLNLEDQELRRKCFSGAGIGGSGYLVVGGGVSTPRGEYFGRVFIVAIGIGTPQIGFDGTYSKPGDVRAKEIWDKIMAGGSNYGQD